MPSHPLHPSGSEKGWFQDRILWWGLTAADVHPPLKNIFMSFFFFFLIYFFIFLPAISPVQFFFSPVQHGDPVTHTGTHFFSHIILLHHK